MRCLGCQYNLKNLTPVGGGGEHRCPECGRAFDPNDATSFGTRDYNISDASYMAWFVIAVLGGVSILAFVGIAYRVFKAIE
jgi:hypothetical protein